MTPRIVGRGQTVVILLTKNRGLIPLKRRSKYPKKPHFFTCVVGGVKTKFIYTHIKEVS